ncbi:hypothetical protein [Mycobacteroides abscessus]|uniref:hypothetical protein n=1 Tax=Mycobacteroides abscessus TaxID=36809 RepID=UPI000C26A81E|nr:hypothetical protein [Mycobacteroides abscessus]
MTDTPTRNTELMLKVWNHLTENPEAHNQRHWALRSQVKPFAGNNVCGTRMCLCGDAMKMSGYEFKFDECGVTATRFKRPDGTTDEDFIAEGQKLFGLNREQATHLFTCTIDNVDALTLLRSLIDDGEEFERDLAGCLDCRPSHEGDS